VSYAQPGNWKTTRRRILERDGHTCYLCAGPAVTVDHLVNVAAGGGHEDTNLAAVCKPCHDRKSARERVTGQRSRKARTQAQHPGFISRSA